MIKIKESFAAFNSFLEENKNLITFSEKFNTRNRQDNFSTHFYEKVDSQFYEHFNDYTVNWKLMNGNEDDLRFTGSMKMLSESEICKDWKGIIYFENSSNDSELKNFKPVDLFSNDACAGFFLNGSNHLMHLYNYEGKPMNLGLSIDNYVLMALDFRCFYFWQYIIQSFIDNEENEVLRDYIHFCTNQKGMLNVEILKKKYNEKKSI